MWARGEQALNKKADALDISEAPLSPSAVRQLHAKRRNLKYSE
jgi:hypothetical protein